MMGFLSKQQRGFWPENVDKKKKLKIRYPVNHYSMWAKYFTEKVTQGKVKDCINSRGHLHAIMEHMGDSHWEITVEHMERNSML